MRVLEAPDTDERPNRPVIRWVAVAGIVALLAGGAIGFTVGRGTAPLHRHPTDAPRFPGLEVDVSCRQVLQRELISNADEHGIGDEPQHLVRIQATFRSAWPKEFFSEEEPDVAFVAGPAEGTVGFHDIEELEEKGPTGSLPGGFIYYGSQRAQQWMKQVQPEPLPDGEGVRAVGPYPVWNEREGSGAVEMGWLDGGGELPIQVGFFDVDNTALVVQDTATCPR